MEISEVIKNTDEIINQTELKALLSSGRALNIKLGVDPTSADLHLGHAVVLRKLKQFQDAGHQTYLVIGDFTAGIGDPAGVNKTRPVLTEAEIRQNMETYLDQAGKILDLEKTHIVYNSEWLKTMNLGQFIGYAHQISINQLIEREDFAARLKESQSVGLHEFIYPLVQAIDSVYLHADVELGGVDQRLNFLLARDLQKKLGQTPQVVILVKLLVGLDGVKKMSKSQHNYIGLTESPTQMFGKLMRLPDELIDDYAESHDIELPYGVHHPRDRKAAMAARMVAIYHGDEAAAKAAEGFDQTFRQKSVSAEHIQEVKFDDPEIPLIQAVTQSSGVSSSEARRLIEQNGVKVNGEVASDSLQRLKLRSKKVLLQIGKHRFFELVY